MLMTAEQAIQAEEQSSSASSKHKMALNYAEQVCTSRCTAKWLQGKDVIDEKIKGQI